MDKWLDPQVWMTRWQALNTWLIENFFTVWSLLQGLALAAGLLLAILIARKYSRKLRQSIGTSFKAHLCRISADILLPGVWMLMSWLAVSIFIQASWPSHLLETGASLLTAWVIIRLVSKLVRNPAASRLIVWVAWIIAALNILNLLDPAMLILDSLAINFSDNLRISVLDIIKSTLSLAVLLWIAIQGSGLLENRIHSSKAISPSLQVLLSKSLNIVLIGLAVILAVRSVGIDLTALAVFGGAIGLGIGFGLQKIIGNLISGVILLLDKSIKPGDVIAVDDSYGWVNTLGGRYVSVITRDGTEHLIPNETLITEKVENWTHSDRKMRVKAPVGIHYNADPNIAIKLCREAAQSTDRVLSDPPVACLLRGFGDNSVDLEVRFWIQDAQNGIANVTSAVLLKIWNVLKENGIEIPYPQRDVHIRSSSVAALTDAITQGNKGTTEA